MITPDASRASHLISLLLHESEPEGFTDDVKTDVSGEQPGWVCQTTRPTSQVSFKIELEYGSNGLEFTVSVTEPITFQLEWENTDKWDESSDDGERQTKQYTVPVEMIKIHREEKEAMSGTATGMVHLTFVSVNLENGIPQSADVYWSI